MAKIKLNLIKGQRTLLGVDTYIGSIKISDLIKADPKIPKYKGKGYTEFEYQREAKPSRVTAVKNRFIDSIDELMMQNEKESKPKRIEEYIDRIDKSALIDSINLNIRKPQIGEDMVKPMSLDESDPGSMYKFDYDSEIASIYIVDGQTRYLGLKEAIQYAKDNNYAPKFIENLQSLTINFTLTFTDKASNEAFMFYMLNNYSAKIPVEGISRILQMGLKDGNENFARELSGKEMNAQFFEIAEDLNEDPDSPWFDKMSDYNDGGKILTIDAMSKRVVKQYEKVIKLEEDTRKSKDENFKYDNKYDALKRLLNAQWSAVKKIYPMAFSQSGYSIQKSSAAEVLTALLCHAANDEIQRENSSKIRDTEFWVGKLRKPLTTLKDKNTMEPPKPVAGHEVWITGESGAIGKYTAGKAKKVMINTLVAHYANCRVAN